MTITVDVAVIGAGLAGLVCAQQLKQMGYRVIVVEKSRGVGGRLATRRLQSACADHGAPYLTEQGVLSRCLIQALRQRNILQPWTHLLPIPAAGRLLPDPEQPAYAATAGITAVGKFLATGLEIWRNHRVQTIQGKDKTWQLILEAADPVQLTAGAVVVAIPAPQALLLLEPLAAHGLPPDLLQALHTVEFDPCISVIATYAPAQRQTLQTLQPVIPWVDGSDLAWISLEQTKHPADQFPVVVLQSTAAFAQRHLEADNLMPIGQLLLDQAAKTFLPELKTPVELQVHRWRYALVRQPLKERYLSTNSPLPLVCSGDWCSGKQIENALESGLAAAYQISHLLTDQTRLTSDQLTSTELTSDEQTQFLALIASLSDQLDQSAVLD